MSNITFFIRFEEIVEQIFEANGYRLSHNTALHRTGRNILSVSPDFIANDGKGEIGVEVKFYRASTPSRRVISGIVAQLGEVLSVRGLPRGKLVISWAVPQALRSETLTDSRIEIVDLHELLVMAAPHDRLYQELVELLRVSRLETASPTSDRGTETYDQAVVAPIRAARPTVDAAQAQLNDYEQTVNRINDLIVRIGTSSAGPRGAKIYEGLCLEAIKELFKEDFGEFKEQHRISGGFHRLDFIASIKSQSPFWISLRNDFRSRYVVFEIKNYKTPISQSEIYSTEKYLFTHALRSVAFLIARRGENKGALHARQGALREMGKLIILITQEELIKMLQMKIDNEDLISILADKVDDFLTTLAR